MNLNQLKYFLAIVKTGSFSNAADDMYISQSSMSKQIKALETELGVDLFKREHSKVYLTEIGAEFAKYAEMTIKQHNDMLLYLDEFATKKSNTIRFGSIPVVSSYGISAQIAQFTTNYKPDVNVVIDMHETNQQEVMKAFERHGIEKKTKCLTTRHKILMEILQTAPNISLLPLSLVDLTLFPHLCTVPLVEELTSDVALIKLKKRRLNKITKDFWIYWQKYFQMQ